jgi:hypothetical protein
MCINDSFSWEEGSFTHIMIDGSGITLTAGKGHLSPVFLRKYQRTAGKMRCSWGSCVLIYDVKNSIRSNGMFIIYLTASQTFSFITQNRLSESPFYPM